MKRKQSCALVLCKITFNVASRGMAGCRAARTAPMPPLGHLRAGFVADSLGAFWRDGVVVPCARGGLLDEQSPRAWIMGLNPGNWRRRTERRFSPRDTKRCGAAGAECGIALAFEHGISWTMDGCLTVPPCPTLQLRWWVRMGRTATHPRCTTQSLSRTGTYRLVKSLGEGGSESSGMRTNRNPSAAKSPSR